MEKYLNKSGNSGIDAFDIGSNYINVLFTGGGVYLYNYHVTGREHVEKMKLLARKGEGLNRYISKFVADNYARKREY